MKIKTIKNILLVGLVLLVSGCASSNVNQKTGAEKKQEIMKVTFNLDKPVDETKVYIDNSIDIKRSEKIMDIIYKSLTNGDIKEFDIDKEVIKLKSTAPIKYWYRRINSIPTRIPGPYVISNYCAAFCDTLKVDPLKLTRTKHTITFENYNTIKHIVMGYKGLSDKFFEFGKDIPYSTISNYAIQVPLKLDKKWLTTDKMILSDEYLKAYSIKKQLRKQLIMKGFQLIDNKENADIVIAVENLGFGEIGQIKNRIKAPSYLPSNAVQDGRNFGSLAEVTHLSGGGSTTGGAKLSLAFGAIGIASDLLSNSKDFLYTFNAVTIYQNKVLIKRAYINTPKVKDYGILRLDDDNIDRLNHDTVMNFIDNNLQIKINGKKI